MSGPRFYYSPCTAFVHESKTRRRLIVLFSVLCSSCLSGVTARRYASAVYAVVVCSSVRLSVTSRYITTRSSTRSLRSSSAPLLHVPFRRTSVGKRSFSTAAPSVWNSLPVSVQNCDTLTLFKSRLKAHLFSSVYAS